MGNSNSNSKDSKQTNKPSSSSSSTISTDSSSNTTLPHSSAPSDQPLPLCHIINAKDDENYDDILLAKQEQLLLLHHSYNCYYENNCPCTSQCAATKSLLRHMETCTEGQKCPVPRCQSSRDILRHFYNCSNPQCECCFPVFLIMADAMQQRDRRVIRRRIPNVTTVGSPNIFSPSTSLASACQLATTRLDIKKIPYY